MKVLVNANWMGTLRKEVEVVVVSTTPTTLRVRLPDGRVVKRKKKRDLVRGT